MSSQTAAAIALMALALVWAYTRHVFDIWLGLASPSGTIYGPDTPIGRTGTGYGKVTAMVMAPETSPVAPSGTVTSPVIYRPLVNAGPRIDGQNSITFASPIIPTAYIGPIGR
jgi:hypothetical protein